MSAAKKRKVTVTTSKTIPSSRGVITTFTKVSKYKTISKTVHERETWSISDQIAEELDADRKRKLVESGATNLDSGNEASNILHTAITQEQRDVRPLPARASRTRPNHPQTPKKPILAPSNVTSQDTPTKGSRTLLEGLALSSPSSADSPSSLLRFRNTITSSHKPSFKNYIIKDQPAKPKETLPQELLDLVNLHSSFLTALSLHQAHNGVHTPADLQQLCPDVARAWGKRAVLLNDIRKILGVLNSDTGNESNSKERTPGPLSLSDYGQGKICVEVKTETGKKGDVARPLNENSLNDKFASNLRMLWEVYKSFEHDASPADFVQSLLLETASICSSLAKVAPLMGKGQRRLEDLRAAIISKNQVRDENVTAPQATGDTGVKPTLLERLRAKALQQSTLPAPPSKAELARKAALHRMEEVVSILSLLTTSTSVGQQRASFTMPTILGKLRDSLKTLISKEEGETCIRLLASDIAPEWLKVVKMGKLNAVVINRDCRPSDLDIRERVQRAL